MSGRNRKGKGFQVPLFISKLLQMVENPEIQAVISWTSTADSFNIKNVSRFTEEVLPRYFKHRNFSSFIRQLNMYGFRKAHHPDGENVYMHTHFKAGSRAQLRSISRKAREEKEERIVVFQGERASNREIQELKSRQKNLEQMCRHFFIQNQKLAEENQKLIKKMEVDAKQRQKRIEDLLITFARRSQILPQNLALSPFEHLPPSGNQSRSTKEMSQKRQVRGDILQGSEVEGEDIFLSINDFLNADNYDDDINLEESL